jgi:hypothetical protein
VDDAAYSNLSKYTWRVIKTSARTPEYAVTKIDGKLVYMHRMILGDGKYVADHINGNGLDNRASNLRKVTPQQNATNSKKKKCGTTSKFKGVGWVKKDSAYQARIRTPNGRISLGYFKNELDAALAYNAKAYELYGDYAKLNEVAPCQ